MKLIERPGLFHEPTEDAPVWGETFDVPHDAESVHLRFVMHTAELIQPAGEKLFWLGWPRHRDLAGFAIWRRGAMVLRSGFGQVNDDKARHSGRLRLEADGTYEVWFDFLPGDVYQLAVDGPGAEEFVLEGKPNINHLPTGSKRGRVTFGGEGTPAEPIQIGARFYDLVLSVDL